MFVLGLALKRMLLEIVYVGTPKTIYVTIINTCKFTNQPTNFERAIVRV